MCDADFGLAIALQACRHDRPVPQSEVGQNWREVQWGRIFDTTVKLPDGVNSSMPISPSPSPEDSNGGALFECFHEARCHRICLVLLSVDVVWLEAVAEA